MRETRGQQPGTLTHRVRLLGKHPTLLFIAAPSTPNKNHKRGARRARQNKTPGSDSITLRGRQSLISPTASAGPTVTYLDPSAFGDRVTSIAGNFVRFRIKSLRFQYVAIAPSTDGGVITYGVQDDVSTGTEVPTNRDQVLNLRKAVETAVWRSKSLSWHPLDSSKWYYVQGSSATSGDRFTVPGSLIYTTSSTDTGDALGFIDVFYVIEFAGASVTVLTSSSSAVTPLLGPRLVKQDASEFVQVARPLTGLKR